MKPPPLTYKRAESLPDALSDLEAHGDDAAVLAGGQSLVPMLNLRLAAPGVLVDVSRLDELRYVRLGDDGLSIGATTTQRALETAAPSRLEGFEVLREAVGWVGHYPVRTRGTIGGSLAHADPAAEVPLLAVLFEAQVRLARRGGERWVPATAFLKGFLDTDRQPDELVTEVRFPRLPSGSEAVFTEHARRHGDFGLVLAAAAVAVGDGVCESARIALGGVAQAPVRLPEVEAELRGRALDDGTIDEAAAEVAARVDPPDDAQATAAYRRDLARALVRRCLVRGRERAATTRT